MNVIRKTTTLPDGREISIETGALAKQADGAVVLTCGETMLLATAVAKKDVNVEVDFLPLSVDYMEKYAASGRFPGGFFKRDGRMGEHEILVSRLIDRAIRPLFPDDYHGDTQVMVELLSTDSEEQSDALACLAASAALCVSDIPFPDPVAEVRVVRKDGEFLINPPRSIMEECDLDLMVAATSDSINMVEGEMKEVSEEVMLEALKVAHESIRILCALQEELRAEAGKETREYDILEFDEGLYNEIDGQAQETIGKVARGSMGKEERGTILSDLKKEIKESLTEKYGEEEYFDARFQQYFKKIQKKIVRGVVVNETQRLDGRKLDEIRPIWGKVSYMPRTHGSAVFTRGETQALCNVTLGTKLDEQTIDTVTYRGSKRFLLQYTFPGYSTGEVKFNRGPARREIGHGNLAERALKPMVPTDLDYTVRVVSNILESNGSSSMASVCGGCMALMDAGINIRRPVSGIAMGLITTEDGFAVLSDILGDEDFLGDMDFKVAGTTEGLTACQMDIKIRGLSYEIIEKALQQSKAGRLHILDEMLKVIPEVASEMSRYAPRFFTMDIPHEFFGMVIGPGGKIIKEIQAQTGSVINLEEGENNIGKATISADNADSITAAVQQIRALIQMPEVGETYKAKVKSIMDYGAFVEFLPGKEGLLHISEISWERLPSMDGVFEIGQDIEIKLTGVDQKSGKFRLSRKVLLEKPEGYVERPPRERRDRGDRGDRRGGDRRGGGDRDRRGPRRH
ncbi:MAG: polyribonucleotide nucleotidyltransferase [Bacteroidia bacterium]|nr:polyribonucleotide nucleotidyltransferase [Bacteroidia bacterium]